ncbi:hypothetical protein [Serratia fonticola]
MERLHRRRFLRYFLLLPMGILSARQGLSRGFFGGRNVVHVTPDVAKERVRYLISSGRTVRFSEGVFNLGRIKVPSSCAIVGSGELRFSDENKSWEGIGTLILGSIDCSGSNNFSVSNLTIDCYDKKENALYGVTPDTGPAYINNVTTRANNHGQLWEANDDNPENKNSIGGIVVTDCTHYHGPNGFVTKQKNVRFTNCKVINIDVQAFVIVSDNINGPRVFSRATDSVVYNCSVHQDVNNGSQGIRVYSRDYSGEGLVLGVDGVSVFDFSAIGLGSNAIRVGDFNVGDKYKSVISKNIRMNLGKAIYSKNSEINVSYCDSVQLNIKNKMSRIESGVHVYNVSLLNKNHKVGEDMLFDVSNGRVIESKRLVRER